MKKKIYFARQARSSSGKSLFHRVGKKWEVSKGGIL